MDAESAEAGGGSQPTAAASSHKEAMGETEHGCQMAMAIAGF